MKVLDHAKNQMLAKAVHSIKVSAFVTALFAGPLLIQHYRKKENFFLEGLVSGLVVGGVGFLGGLRFGFPNYIRNVCAGMGAGVFISGILAFELNQRRAAIANQVVIAEEENRNYRVEDELLEKLKEEKDRIEFIRFALNKMEEKEISELKDGKTVDSDRKPLDK